MTHRIITLFFLVSLSLLTVGCQSKKDAMQIICGSPINETQTGQKAEFYIEQNVSNAEVKAFWADLMKMPPDKIEPAFRAEVEAVGLTECTALQMMQAKK